MLKYSRVKITCYLLLTGAGVFLRPPDIQYVAQNSHYLVLTGAGVFLRPPDIQYVAHNSHYLVLTGAGVCHKTPRYTVCLTGY